MLDDQPTGFSDSSISGTIRYLAPELLEDPNFTIAGDVFAFGAVCVEVCVVFICSISSISMSEVLDAVSFSGIDENSPVSLVQKHPCRM